MELEVNRIALYLAGKLPPYYKPFDKMEFMEELMGIFSDNFTESTFNFIENQAKTEEQFYSMALNKAKRIDEKKLILFLDKINVEEDARSICINEKKENLDDSNDLEKEINELKIKIEELTKPFIITEGKTDVEILKTAWEKLYPEKKCPFDIIESGLENQNGSANVLKNQLNYVNLYGINRTIIGLFDNDKEGNSQFKGLDKNIFEEYSIDKDIRKHRKYNVYGMLLPVPKFREKFVSKTNIEKRFFEIEHYFSDEILKANKMIKEDSTFADGIFEIGNSKNAFAKAVKKLNKKDFENFKILFDRIEKYI